MGYVVGSLNVIAPLLTGLLVRKAGQKMFILISTSVSAASMLFLALLAHFHDNDLVAFIEENSSGFGWTVQAAILGFIAAHQIGNKTSMVK